jgi:hypothetical protein
VSGFHGSEVSGYDNVESGKLVSPLLGMYWRSLKGRDLEIVNFCVPYILPM